MKITSFKKILQCVLFQKIDFKHEVTLAKNSGNSNKCSEEMVNEIDSGQRVVIPENCGKTRIYSIGLTIFSKLIFNTESNVE